MRKRIIGLAAATTVLAATLMGGAANAYTLDTAAGTGFVGKGEVQQVMGWNNKTLQENASNVVFTYESTDDYSAVCTFVTGEGTRGEKTHNVAHTTETAVIASVNGDPRQTKGQNQFTGFNLAGFGDVTEAGVIPVVGEPCPGNEGHDGLWTAVTLVSSTGGLYANGHLLTVTPVVAPAPVVAG